MKFLFTFFVLFSIINLPLFAQQSNVAFFRSQGDFPVEFFKDVLPYNCLTYNEKAKKLVVNSESDQQYAKLLLKSSGLVIYGNSDLEKVQNELYQLLLGHQSNGKFVSKNPVYIFRSTVPTTFSIDSTVFITSGLLSKCKTKKQLQFYILRELEWMNQESINVESNIMFEQNSYSQLIEFVSFRNGSTNKKIDDMARSRMSSIGSFTENEFTQSLVVLRNAKMPIDNIEVKEDYLNSKNLQVPANLLKVQIANEAAFRDKMNSILEYERLFDDRIALSKDQLANFDEGDLEDGIRKLVIDAQKDKAMLEIVECNFYSALYSIYCLEEIGEEMDELKALAWLGIIDQEFGGITKRKNPSFFGDRHKSTGFVSFLNFQNGYSKVVLGLNEMTKLKQKYPSDNSFAFIYDQAIDVLNNSKYFNAKTYSVKNSTETVEHVVVKETDFYLGWFHQLVDTAKIVPLEERNLLAEQISSPSKAYTNEVHVNALKQKKLNEKRTKKLNETFDVNFYYTSTEEYNRFENYGLMFYQANEGSHYLNNFLPVNYKYFAKNAHETSIHCFSGTYRVTLKPVYFIGLTGIGLAYVIPNMLIGSQNSWHTNAQFDNQGRITSIRQHFYRDYLNKSSIAGRINTNNN